MSVSMPMAMGKLPSREARHIIVRRSLRSILGLLNYRRGLILHLLDRRRPLAELDRLGLVGVPPNGHRASTPRKARPPRR